MSIAGPGNGILRRTTPADQGPVEFPTLAPHLRFHVIGKRQTLLVSETFNTLLHGGLYCDLLPLLDGQRAQGKTGTSSQPSSPCVKCQQILVKTGFLNQKLRNGKKVH